MKKFSISLTILITLILVLTPLFQSCLDDGDEYYLAIATYRLTENEDAYFVLDEGETMHPQHAKYGKLKDGQRAYIYFDILDEKIEGYDYNIRVRGIYEILTKEVISLTEETADSIGDDKINITGMWFGDGYLNLQFQFLGTRNPDKLHMINLVRNETEEGETEEKEEGYISLEFRHNAYNDRQEEVLNGIAAFKGPFIEEEMKGLKIRYNSIYEGAKYRKIDFPKEQTKRSSPFSTNALPSTFSDTQ